MLEDNQFSSSQVRTPLDTMMHLLPDAGQVIGVERLRNWHAMVFFALAFCAPWVSKFERSFFFDHAPWVCRHLFHTKGFVPECINHIFAAGSGRWQRYHSTKRNSRSRWQHTCDSEKHRQHEVPEPSPTCKSSERFSCIQKFLWCWKKGNTSWKVVVHPWSFHKKSDHETSDSKKQCSWSSRRSRIFL